MTGRIRGIPLCVPQLIQNGNENMNPKNSVDRDRLFRALELSYRQLRGFRQGRYQLIREYVGDQYGGHISPYADNVPPKEIYLNLMMQTAEAYTMALAANRPRVFLISFLQTSRFSQNLKKQCTRVFTLVRTFV